jgi:hypothetical protein
VPLIGPWAIAAMLAAEPGLASIHVSREPAARECPDATALAQKTRDRVGRPALDVDRPEGAPLALEVEFTKIGPAFRAVLKAQGRVSGVRTIEDSSPSCGALADAVALALALLVGEEQANLPSPNPVTPEISAPLVSTPDARPREPPAGPAPLATAAPPRPESRAPGGDEPALPRNFMRPTAPPSEAPSGISLAVGLGLGAASGIVSAASVLPVLSLGLLPKSSPWSLEAEGLLIPSTVLPFTGGGSVHVSFEGARVLGCFALLGDLGSARLSACLGGTGGRIQADGEGLVVQRSVVRPWFAGSAGVLARGALISGLGWFGRAGAEIAIDSESFSLDNMTQAPAYAQPRVALGASAGVAWTIE